MVGSPGASQPAACVICGGILPSPRAVCCSGKCRAALSRQRKAQARAEREQQITAYLATAWEALAAARRMREAHP